MSKDRARRRAAREAEQERTAATRARDSARRARRAHERDVARSRRRRRAMAVRRLLPGRGVTARRSRAQRAVIGCVLALAFVLIWLFVGSWTLRVALGLLTLLVAPAATVAVLDRADRR